jgi:hypothetical protein
MTGSRLIRRNPATHLKLNCCKQFAAISELTSNIREEESKEWLQRTCTVKVIQSLFYHGLASVVLKHINEFYP